MKCPSDFWPEYEQRQEEIALGEYVQFTKRTNYPKLGWLMGELEKRDIHCFVSGESFHAPISWVHPDDLDEAWSVLDPVDDLPDDHEMFL